VINVYTLVLAVMTLSAGSLGDLFGQRQVFIGSLVIFVLASLACGVAPDVGMLIAARGVQAIGGAAMIGTTLALLGNSYSGKERGTAIGMWSAVLGLAAAAGPMLGGLLTQYLGWRSIFFVNLPVGVVTLLLATFSLGDSPRRAAARIDWAGMALFALFAGTLTYGLISTNHAMFIGAGLALIGFVLVERWQTEPMLDVGLFRDTAFTAIMVCVLVSSVAFAILVYVSIWLQSSHGFDAFQTGLALVPMAAMSFVASRFMGKRLDVVRPRFGIGAGLVLTGLGCGLILLADGSPLAVIVPGLLLVGGGIGIGGPATNAAVLATVPADRAGMASGALATFRQLGQALGVALLVHFSA
jgi:EmrB/QacA subfamily drug resistance transporter